MAEDIGVAYRRSTTSEERLPLVSILQWLRGNLRKWTRAEGPPERASVSDHRRRLTLDAADRNFKLRFRGHAE